MQHYYVSKQAQSNGHHEVHVPRCVHLPETDNRIYLGSFTNCGDALREAKSHFQTAAGCKWCCSECRTE